MNSKQETICKYIQENLLNGNENLELSLEDDLLGGGLIDSMGIMQLVAFIEDTFDLKIPPEDIVIENFMNVQSIAEYVEK